jgi:hypothetical protein
MDQRDAAGYIGQGMNFELKTRSPGRPGSRPPRRLLARLLLLGALALIFLPAPPAVAQQSLHDPDAVAASRERVLDGRYQTESPAPREEPETEPWRIPPWLAKTILWAVGIAVGALVLFFLASLVRDLLLARRGAGRAADHGAPEAPRVETLPPHPREAERRSLAEADALAADGRFSEAIHLLLLVALERLRGELGPRVAPAMTGREVLRLAAIPEPASAPLTRMVALSEINHFGGRRAGEPDYRRCREDFLRFNGLDGAPA